jgi:hypothetical protein
MRLVAAREKTLDDALVEALQQWVWNQVSVYEDAEQQGGADERASSALALDPVRRRSWNAIDATLSLLRSAKVAS